MTSYAVTQLRQRSDMAIVFKTVFAPPRAYRATRHLLEGDCALVTSKPATDEFSSRNTKYHYEIL